MSVDPSLDPVPEPVGSVQPPRSGSTGVIGPFTRRHLVALAGVVVAVTVLLLVVTSPMGTGPIGGPPGRQSPAPGGSFYVIGEPGTGLEIGDRPPPMVDGAGASLVDLQGRSIDLGSYLGRPVWILFWATWCPPCQRETPDIERAWQANKDTGLEIVAVDVQENADIAREYAATYGLTYPVVQDVTASVFGSYGVFGLPTHYFIGRDGLIRDRWFGPLSLVDMQRFIDAIVTP